MGKKNQLRSCPGWGKEITATQCGEARHLRINCPEGCPHNPFRLADYDRALAIEREFDGKMLERLFAESADPAALDARLRAAEEEREFYTVLIGDLYRRRGPGGGTAAERWAAAGWPGLRTDERVYLRGKQGLRVGLLEVQRVIEAGRFEVVDLLSSGRERRLMVDRKLAQRLARFECFLCWTYPLPHYWRLMGEAVTLPEWWPVEPLGFVQEIARNLGGPVDAAELAPWLGEALPRVSRAIRATVAERHRRMAAQTDAVMVAVDYALKTPYLQALSQLDGNANLDAGVVTEAERNEGFVGARFWANEGEQTPFTLPTGNRPTLGRILVGPHYWRTETVGAGRAAKLRREFEAWGRGIVEVRREHRNDWAAAIAHQAPTEDRALVPENLVADVPELVFGTSSSPRGDGQSEADLTAEVSRSYWATFADAPIDGLEGRTPREAATDPALRPRLVSLMKWHLIRLDRENLRTGGQRDLHAVVRGLGLHEIDEPAPPPRPLLDVMGEGRPESQARQTVGRALNRAEAEARLKAVVADWTPGASGQPVRDAAVQELIADVSEIAGGLFNEAELDHLLVYVVYGGLALTAPEAVPPRLELPRVAEALQAESERGTEWLMAPRAEMMAQAFLAGSRQPALLELLAASLVDTARTLPRKRQPRHEQQLLTVLVLKVVLDELDRGIAAQRG